MTQMTQKAFQKKQVLLIYKEMEHKDMQLAEHYYSRFEKNFKTIGKVGLTPAQIEDGEHNTVIPALDKLSLFCEEEEEEEVPVLEDLSFLNDDFDDDDDF